MNGTQPALSCTSSSPAAAPPTGDALDRALRTRLAAWFEREKRALPWRESRDPYRVWISESMLQQTRVETVIPYFLRFLQRFPDVRALAEAPIEDVLAAWSGLGYYRRARSLHAAAQALVEALGGEFPRTAAELGGLPGIGPYTAGAVASIAFDAPEPLVDGNVARVFARIFALDDAPGSKAFRDATWSIAARLVGDVAESAGAWNQALMELGATLCKPREPACGACPVNDLCRARIEGRVAELPRPKERRPPIDVDLQVLVVRARDQILLEQRPPEGRMAGLWQLPTLETSPGGRLAPARHADGIALAEIDSLGEVRHTITCHRVRARVSTGRIAAGEAHAPFAWFRVDEIETLPRTGMTKKIAARGWLGPRIAAGN